MKKFDLFVQEDLVRSNFEDYVVFSFKHERHMYEFMSYRDFDSYGKSRLMKDYPFEVKMLKENFKFK